MSATMTAGEPAAAARDNAPLGERASTPAGEPGDRFAALRDADRDLIDALDRFASVFAENADELAGLDEARRVLADLSAVYADLDRLAATLSVRHRGGRVRALWSRAARRMRGAR